MPPQYATICRLRGFSEKVNAPSAIMKALMGRRRGKTAVSAQRVPEGFSSNHGILSRLCVRKFVNMGDSMTKRTDRLNGELQKEIAAIIAGELKDRDPRITGLVSVTEADVAPDLKTAKVYVSVYAKSPEAKKETFLALRENAGFVRHALAQVMRMRTVPAITFLEDGSMEYGSHMDELFASLHKDEK